MSILAVYLQMEVAASLHETMRNLDKVIIFGENNLLTRNSRNSQLWDFWWKISTRPNTNAASTIPHLHFFLKGKVSVNFCMSAYIHMYCIYIWNWGWWKESFYFSIACIFCAYQQACLTKIFYKTWSFLGASWLFCLWVYGNCIITYLRDGL